MPDKLEGNLNMPPDNTTEIDGLLLKSGIPDGLQEAVASEDFENAVNDMMESLIELKEHAEGKHTGIIVHSRTAKAVTGAEHPVNVHLDSPTKETLEAMLEAEKIAKDSSTEAFHVEDALEALKRR